MIEAVTIAGVIVAVFVPLSIKFEHRLTRVEDKVDSLLTKNGLNPQDCIKKKAGGKK